ncbi:hypothetical protein DB347_18850 [Opitutaceae bacterium EW11]|nr:hypothetical protein DB347_18850 [Opitutaceae bacterium EW11]
MSLINDALKKAQQQREKTPGSQPGSPAPTAAASPASPPARNSSRTFTLLLVGGCALIAVSVAVTVYLLRGDRTEPRPAIASAKPVPTLVPAAAEPVKTTPPASTTAGTQPAAATPAATLPSTASIPAKPEASPAIANAPEPVRSAPVPEPPKTAATETPVRPAEAQPAVKLTFRIQGMVDKFRIAGIRLSDTDSKVILNDHLFRQNDLIEPSIGLRLTKIEPHTLTFTDAEGNTYVKRF